jgi:adenylate cyclase
MILAIIAGAAFLPIVWLFGSRMAQSLKAITAPGAQTPEP